MIGHTTSSCSTKIDIGKMVNGDELILFLNDRCAFKPVENDQVNIIYRSIINWPKIKHLRCQQLLCSTKRCINKRPNIDNLIVKVTFYDNNGDGIIGFYNIIEELNLIIIFIDYKKYSKGTLIS